MKITKTSFVVIPVVSALLLSGCTYTINTKLDWFFHSSISIEEVTENSHYRLIDTTKDKEDLVFYFWYGSSKSRLVSESLLAVKEKYPELTIDERPVSLNDSWIFAARFHIALSAFKEISKEDQIKLYDLWSLKSPTKNELNLKLYEWNLNPKLFWGVFNSEDVTNTLHKYNDKALNSGVKALPGLIINNKYDLNSYSLNHAEDIFVVIEHLLKKDS